MSKKLNIKKDKVLSLILFLTVDPSCCNIYTKTHNHQNAWNRHHIYISIFDKYIMWKLYDKFMTKPSYYRPYNSTTIFWYKIQLVKKLKL